MTAAVRVLDPGRESSLAVESALEQGAGDSLFQCLAWVAAFHGDERSVTAWRHGIPLNAQANNPQSMLRAAEKAGYVATLVARSLDDLPEYVLPVIVLLNDGQAAVLIRRLEGDMIEAALPESPDALLPVQLPLATLAARAAGHVILIKPPVRRDQRAGTPPPPPAAHWFWSALWCYRSYYANTVLAAVMINILTLASVFFTMNVYDRVVPAHAYATLWSLAIGTALAMLFEFSARLMRSHLIDLAGKKVDLVLGSRLFQQVLGIRLESRPASSGAFASRLREYESLREFSTSATVSALTDLPFALLFLCVIIGIGGVLAWVPALAIVVVVVISLIVQWPLARHMQENLREAALKHGLLIESLEGIETLKAINGLSRMQKNWEDYSAVAAQSFMKTRELTATAVSLVGFVQQIETVILVVWGVYLIHAGTLSQGALIGVVMLARQVVSPLGQVVALAVRYQQAKASLVSLDKLMQEKTDHDPEQNYISRPRFDGELKTSVLHFTYPNCKLPALTAVNLKIRAGERIAILGRIGSGKSTLLRLLAGLYLPSKGSVYADGIDLRQVNPADVRHNTALVPQDCRLFHGSLRDNLSIGVPHASVDRLLQVCRITGLDGMIARHPMGMDMPIGEGGAGLSGGQRQLVALSRALLSDPPVLLLDEPTSSMDAQTEHAFVEQLKRMPGDRTLIISTHRMSLLDLVDRVIVLDQGRVAADGPKQQVVKILTSGGVPVPENAEGKA